MPQIPRGVAGLSPKGIEWTRVAGWRLPGIRDTPVLCFVRTQWSLEQLLAEPNMNFFLIAMLPSGEGLLIGMTVVAAILTVFLGSKVRLDWRRLRRLCVLAFVLGSLAGAGVAVFAVVFGDVHPLDRWHLGSGILIVGTVAGLIVAVLMGIIGTIQIMRRSYACQHEHSGTAESPHGGSTPGEVVD